jgi:hypothetical protein
MVRELEGYSQLEKGLYVSDKPRTTTVLRGGIATRKIYDFTPCYRVAIAYTETHPTQNQIEEIVRKGATRALQLQQGALIGIIDPSEQATAIRTIAQSVNPPQREMLLVCPKILQQLAEGHTETYRALRRDSGAFDNQPYIIRPTEMYLHLGLIPETTPRDIFNTVEKAKALLRHPSLRAQELGSRWMMRTDSSGKGLQGETIITLTGSEKFMLQTLIDLASHNDLSDDLAVTHASKAVQILNMCHDHSHGREVYLDEEEILRTVTVH